MKNKQGFTLTEVLLAVMIVAIIGVALASLTTTASKESSTGSAKTTLRNRLSLALRQIRSDLSSASNILYIVGNAPEKQDYLLMLLAMNKDRAGNSIQSDKVILPFMVNAPYVVYCSKYDATTQTTSIVRSVLSEKPDALVGICANPGETLVKNVKIASSTNFVSPSFFALDISSGAFFGMSGKYSPPSVVRVQLIVTIPGSKPVMNEAVEEIFLISSAGVKA